MNDMVHVGALGALRVWYGDRLVMPTAVKPKIVLAMLAMSPNNVVSVDALVAELWGYDAPRSAKTVVQTYVLNIRKMIASALPGDVDSALGTAKTILCTTQGGYMLNVAQENVDAWRFEQFVSAGHRARERRDHESASENFARALQCWQGRALADVRAGTNLSLAVTRLEEAWLNVTDCRIDADLRLGRHHELLGELAALVVSHRMHEGFAAHYMLALYRSGRRSEALEVYQDFRANLVREKGLEPSPPLRRLQRSMLVSDRGAGDYDDRRPNGSRDRPRAGGGVGRSHVIPDSISAELASIPWDVPDDCDAAKRGVSVKLCSSGHPD